MAFITKEHKIDLGKSACIRVKIGSKYLTAVIDTGSTYCLMRTNTLKEVIPDIDVYSLLKPEISLHSAENK